MAEKNPPPEGLPEGWREPPPPREQTKVKTVKVAKVGTVVGARRRD